MEPDPIPNNTPEWVRIVHRCGVSERTHEIGEQLTTRGEVGSGFFVVIDGNVDILEDDHNVVASVGQYGLIGELGLLTRSPRTHTAVATTRVRTWHGDLTCFTTALDHDVVRDHLGRTAARRLAEAIQPVVVRGRDDVDLIVRPMLPSDRAAYLDALDGASVETLQTRFFTPSRPTPLVIEQLLNIDFVSQFVWIAARVDSPDVGLGIGRFVAVPEDSDQVELAVTVQPDARG
ncbi:MAG: cyclic nucleotide-binding domain-containing protein, partial [Actinobacteria bacterium]|nr:cyclic nucleotide-binding domain-containing protein [Actinomycetota bacterium]